MPSLPTHQHALCIVSARRGGGAYHGCPLFSFPGNPYRDQATIAAGVLQLCLRSIRECGSSGGSSIYVLNGVHTNICGALLLRHKEWLTIRSRAPHVLSGVPPELLVRPGLVASLPTRFILLYGGTRPCGDVCFCANIRGHQSVYEKPQ